MTEDARLVDAPCLILDAVFSKNKGVGCMYSGAALSSRVAYHDRAGRSSRGGMSSAGYGVFQKQGGLAACVRGQPCGIEQSAMTEDARLVDGPCLILDATFSKRPRGWLHVFGSSLVA